jgi:ankyrin repeat protein
VSIRQVRRPTSFDETRAADQKIHTQDSPAPSQTLIDFVKIGTPGAAAITPSQEKVATATHGVKFLLVGEFFGTTEGQELERHLSLSGQSGISIRLDQLSGHSKEENIANFKALINNLKNAGYLASDTEIYITPHGKASNGTLDICTTGEAFDIDAIELLEILGRGKHDPPSNGAVHFAVCESKPLHKAVQNYPHHFLFYSGSHSIWSDSTTEVLTLQLSFSSRQHNHATSAQSLFKYAGNHSGSDLILSGNGTVTRKRIGPKISLADDARIAQMGRHIRYKFAHGSFQSVLRLFKRFGVDNLKNLVPEMNNVVIDAYLSEKENHYKLALLLLLGFDTNAVDSQGQTALHKACRFGDDNGVKFLLMNGATADIKDTDGKTARELAKSLGFDDIAVTFDEVESGKTFPMLDKAYMFFHLCDVGEQTIASLAVSRHTKFEVSDTKKNTLLMYAIKKRQNDLAKTLLNAGAPIDSVNTLGNSALHLICAANAPAELIRAIRLQYGDGANMNARNHRGFTPLIYAARRGLLDHVNKLINYQADINSQSHKGNTALHMAVFRRDVDMVTTLLDRGADRNIQNHKRHTPMGLAKSLGLTDIVHLLETYRPRRAQ